jgi:hypothetical protein
MYRQVILKRINSIALQDGSCQTKRKPVAEFPLVVLCMRCNVLSAEMGVVAAGPVGQNGRIKHLSAAGALPGIKSADKIIKFLSKHSALAAWTLHSNPPDGVIALSVLRIEVHYIMRAKNKGIRGIHSG